MIEPGVKSCTCEIRARISRHWRQTSQGTGIFLYYLTVIYTFWNNFLFTLLEDAEVILIRKVQEPKAQKHLCWGHLAHAVGMQEGSRRSIEEQLFSPRFHPALKNIYAIRRMTMCQKSCLQRWRWFSQESISTSAIQMLGNYCWRTSLWWFRLSSTWNMLFCILIDNVTINVWLRWLKFYGQLLPKFAKDCECNITILCSDR